MSQSINELEIYREAMSLGEEIWALVYPWDHLAKDTLGKQLIRSADSIAANISEGYGRYHFKENQKFCFYARGSLLETQTWIEKAVHRDLIDKDKGRELYAQLKQLKRRLNS